LQEIGRFDGTCLEAKIWDAIEDKVSPKGLIEP
jgi:hypothetical protein